MTLLKTILLFVVTAWAALLVYDSIRPPISTLMASRVLTLRHVEREFVPLRRISPNLIRAVIAAEDGNFCSHHGVDWKAMRRVVTDVVVEDDATHGASTITMQTAKNLFLWMGYSYARKPIEVPLALLLDAAWSKRHVMQSYLNIAEFGTGIFGAEAASRHYFGKSAVSLTPYEAALLAATLPNPKRRNAAKPTPAVSRYATRIQARMNSVISSCAIR